LNLKGGGGFWLTEGEFTIPKGVWINVANRKSSVMHP